MFFQFRECSRQSVIYCCFLVTKSVSKLGKNFKRIKYGPSLCSGAQASMVLRLKLEDMRKE